MLSRKRTTMAALEPGAKKEHDIDPSRKEAKHCDENGNVNQFAQQFPSNEQQKGIVAAGLKHNQTLASVSRILKSGEIKLKVQETNEMEIDKGYIERSRNYRYMDNSFKDGIGESRDHLGYLPRYQPDEKYKQYDNKMDESD